jgi:hypothetical protein
VVHRRDGRGGASFFLTAAFGINELIERVLEEGKDYLRYVLLEREDEDMEILSRDPNNRFAVGVTYGDTPLGGMLAERLTGLNRHVLYVQTKCALVDPLTDDCSSLRHLPTSASPQQR